VIVNVCSNFENDLAGNYLPLSGSESADVSCMTTDMEKSLRHRGLLFQEPTSPWQIASGCVRDWPDARGMFLNNDAVFFNSVQLDPNLG